MDSENFNLKTAIALLPIMTGQEHVTRALIDGVDFYSSLLCDSAKNVLTSFVLKTRLSDVGKFYLKSEYSDVNQMVNDMREYLLPRKSHVCLQMQLSNCKQESRTIEEFGAEIENLLVDLTLAQLDFLGSYENRNILHPINEKIAIQCFSDGISNYRLRLIMACRQFKTLREAIQVASDEYIMMEILEKNRVRNFEYERSIGYRNKKKNFAKKIIVEKETDSFKKRLTRNSWAKYNQINDYRRKPYYKKQPVCREPLEKLQFQQAQRIPTPDADVPSVRRTSIPKCADTNNFSKTNVMKFEYDMNNGKTVNFNVKNESSKFLIDKKANLCVLKYECIRKNAELLKLLKKDRIDIKCAGEKLEYEGYIDLNLESNGVEFQQKFYVIRQLQCATSGIIGNNFLQKYKAYINFVEKTLKLEQNNKTIIMEIRDINRQRG
ncbi:Uncharacterized protein OBRU01_06089 [Operophtera brumata]|uniref:Uncharacterized protein n=1 Tax=Operophtera brumata TaxID=104452 RepID=A0A0L7LJ86_OPEBR|nr:Uncharacterized protein OBRU01_06089 [Operophtera brumata]